MITVAAREHGTFSNDCTQIATWLDGVYRRVRRWLDEYSNVFLFLACQESFSNFQGKTFLEN